MIEQELIDQLFLYLNYDPLSGDLSWKKTGSNRIKVGGKAGYIGEDGRVSIRFKSKFYKAHRLVWLLTYGKWPDGAIDHVDGNPSNNQINNLRDVPQCINTHNHRKPRSSNTSGLVSF